MVLALLVCQLPASAQQSTGTERFYLSGRGPSDDVRWAFSLEGTPESAAATLRVPSNWELEGFGAPTYGQDDEPSFEVGHYRTSFEAPTQWSDRRVTLTFEGVLTDAAATLNGVALDPPHKGGFYRFSYDVTEHLRLGAENTLDVVVHEESSDPSVNRAERDADYWLLGGIFRPVFLEAHPSSHIDHVAIDAQADGAFEALVEVHEPPEGARIRATILTAAQHAVGAGLVDVDEGGARLSIDVTDPETWSAERPRLHELVVELLDDSGSLLHRVTERFGFRTVEVRNDGIYVNSVRTLLRGVNRHSFWPDTGRALDPSRNRADAELIRSLNLNAVRMSHYPPDPEFLDACDELGIYVINELAGWHDAYDASVGRPLVRSMVRRDHNHPSILLWANGNEGGWNRRLDDDFALHDLQARNVIHPWERHGGLETMHYPTYAELERLLNPRSVLPHGRPPVPVLVTEVLHGLYDGGSSAGLEDYWSLLSGHPRGAGLFLWSFFDEGLLRDGAIDTFGNYAPDGIVGPYREWYETAFGVRNVFSPVAIRYEPHAATLELESRYDEKDLADHRLTLRWLVFPSVDRHPDEAQLLTSEERVTGRNELHRVDALPPRGAHALQVVVNDGDGFELVQRTFPLDGALNVGPTALSSPWLSPPEAANVSMPAPSATNENDRVLLRAGAAEAVFSATTGQLDGLSLGDAERSFLSGPRVGSGALDRVEHTELEAGTDSAGVTFLYGTDKTDEESTRLVRVRFTLRSDGWLLVNYLYASPAMAHQRGVRFEWADETEASLTWLGEGPGRVWQNRRVGTSFGLHARSGSSGPGSDSNTGFFGPLEWARLDAEATSLTIIVDPRTFLGLGPHAFPSDARNARGELPPHSDHRSLHLMQTIPAIGTKFHPAETLGPSSQPWGEAGLYGGSAAFRIDARRLVDVASSSGR